MDINEIIERVHHIPEASADKLASCLSEMSLPKGFRVLEAGKVETDIYFIRRGLARAFIPVDGEEITFWLGKEGDAIFSLKSYTDNLPGYETIELMEDSDLYRLKRDALQQLFNEDIGIANWGRRFAEREFLQTEQRLIPFLCTTASERYARLLEESPDLLQRLPLEHLASWLGITPVSLSRIRAKMKDDEGQGQ